MLFRCLPPKALLILGLLAASRCSCGDMEMTMPGDPDLAAPLPDGGTTDLALDLASPNGRPPPVLTPGAADRILLRGTVLTPTGPMVGEVLVEMNSITCVAADCSAQPGAAGATIIATSGVIMPGMLDAHNHGMFNIFDEGDWNPGRFYGNHNQWTLDTRYGQMLDAKQYLAGEDTSPVNVECEMDKYAEIKALVAGTTSMLLAPVGSGLTCFSSVIRTIDVLQNDLGQDRIRVSLAVPSNSAAVTVCDAFTAGTANAYIVHVGEGIDSTALNEFATLESRNGGCLITDKTAIVHGTAFTSAEFTKMAAANMKLIWSPKSNLFLYNDTTRIDLAIAAGLQTIALAPDWSLGGSVNLLEELRTAREVSNSKWPGLLTSQRLIDMVTIDAARALGVSNLLGSIEVGKRADITVVSVDPSLPYDAIIAARPTDMELVLVDGRALYGHPALKSVGPATPGCEDVSVCNVSKFLCIAESATTNKLNQTYPQILQALVTELSSYDTVVSAMGIAPFSPIAQLTKCQ
jgi:5-methylthioadenosine/S-adenosylhomocysteine deaminase